MTTPVARHKTAMSRAALSRPLATAARDEILQPTKTVFDYGCGRGDDIKHLSALGFDVAGWDPNHRPNAERREADIVSLNFNNSTGRLGPEGIGSSTAELTDQKIQWVRDGAGARFSEIELEIAAYFTVVTPDGAGTLGKMAPMFGMTPEVMAQHPHVLIGSVDEICDRLVERRERFGISYVSFGTSNMDAIAPVVSRLSGT